MKKTETVERAAGEAGITKQVAQAAVDAVLAAVDPDEIGGASRGEGAGRGG